MQTLLFALVSIVSLLNISTYNSYNFAWTPKMKAYIFALKSETKLRKNNVAHSSALKTNEKKITSDEHLQLAASGNYLRREQKLTCVVEIGERYATRPYD